MVNWNIKSSLAAHRSSNSLFLHFFLQDHRDGRRAVSVHIHSKSLYNFMEWSTFARSSSFLTIARFLHKWIFFTTYQWAIMTSVFISMDIYSLIAMKEQTYESRRLLWSTLTASICVFFFTNLILQKITFFHKSVFSHCLCMAQMSYRKWLISHKQHKRISTKRILSILVRRSLVWQLKRKLH